MKFIVMMSLLVSASAFAETYFDKLGSMFATGTRPAMSKVININWSGRCFFKSEPNKPTGASFIMTKKTNGDVGPIGNGTVNYVAYSYTDATPNHYDNKTVEEVLQEIRDLSSGADPEATDIKFLKDSLQANWSAEGKSLVRLSGSYLIEEFYTAPSDAGPISNFELKTRCYYFLPGYEQ